MKKYILVLSLAIFSVFYSCKKETIGVYSSNNYVAFVKEMKDTTIFSFFFYPNDEVKFPCEVKLIGKILDKDTEFSVVADETKTTLDKSLYSIPQTFKFRAGRVTDTIFITLKNNADLVANQYVLQLKIKDGKELFSAKSNYATAVIMVSDKAERPAWWTLLFDADGNQNRGSVEQLYLGAYSRKKYELFMKVTGFSDLGEGGEMRIRSVLFLQYLNEEAAKGTPVTEEDGTLMKVPVVG